MIELILTSGIPGSGKSTWIQNTMLKKPNSIWISRDKIRFALLKDGEDYFSHEDEVISTFVNCVNTALHSNWKTVFADATFLTEKARNKILDKLDLSEVEITVVDFNVPLNLCLKRNEKRKGREYVSRSVIRRMFYQKTPVINNEKYNYKQIIEVTK